MKVYFLFFFMLVFQRVIAQSFTRKSYHDKEKKYIKELYQVKDTALNILHGHYTAYYMNGSVESKGQFYDNETVGVWEFYFETGNLRMRGVLQQYSNDGLWEYFYRNGRRSMEGAFNKKKQEGLWKIYYESGELREMGGYQNDKRTGMWTTYYEDGTKRGEIEYNADQGYYTEYYHSGKKLAEGLRVNTHNTGHWITYTEDGQVESEGDYTLGKKNGEWKFFKSGKLSSQGKYENDEPVGEWIYYYEDGKVSSKGNFVNGKKSGYWISNNRDGTIKSEVTHTTEGSNDYREYYSSGKLKTKGQIVNGKKQGKWQYLYEDGKTEGECEFDEGKGTYSGYYPNGELQTKGSMEDDLRVGTWEIYEATGKLSGYYKPFYEDNELANSINALVKRGQTQPTVTSKTTTHTKRFTYFSHRDIESRSIILQGNPAFTFIGSFPIGVELYNEARLGHELSFEGLRHPFFTPNAQVPIGKLFDYGYAISLKQKFYNPIKSYLWYFAHEIRYTNITHSANIELTQPTTARVTVNVPEQRIEYGVLLGMRLTEKPNRNGFTLDAFIGYGLGYRNVSINNQFKTEFSSVNTNSFSQTFRFGLNFGYSFSFERR